MFSRVSDVTHRPLVFLVNAPNGPKEGKFNIQSNTSRKILLQQELTHNLFFVVNEVTLH